MKISDFLDANSIILNLNSKTKNEVIEELADKISSTHTQINRERLSEVLIEREELCSTALDSGVAVPHGKISGITDIILGFGRSTEGIPFDSLDKLPSHFFILLIAPEDVISTHIQLLARISRIFKNPDLRAKLMNSEDEEEIFEAIKTEDEKHS